MTPYLSVIIPSYNEEDNLNRGTLDVVIAYLEKQPYPWEVILVNDGSTDSTAQILSDFVKYQKHVRFIDNPHQGKAQTVITGVLAAEGEIILFSDMDQATPIAEFDKFLPKFEEGYDIVIGSRANREGAPLFRKILAFGMVFLRTIILSLPVKDSQCGFKAMTHESAQKVFKIMQSLRPAKTIEGPAVDPGLDVEMIYLGRKLGYKIVEVPVSWRHQESRRVSFIKDAKAGLMGLLVVRLRSLTNAYKLR